MNILAQMFEGAWDILFPKPARKYSRDRLGKFTVKFNFTWIGDNKPQGKLIKYQDDRRIVFYE
jgi:hypothetical protein